MSFSRQLHPAIEGDLAEWRSDPLARLVRKLDTAPDEERFLNTLAEISLARHLISRGCELDVEIPTPAGRSCDFLVRRDSAGFYLHVKRLNSEHPADRQLTISSHFRNLERLSRPYVVGIRWKEGATPRETLQLVEQAQAFILQARVGDELVVRDEHGAELGGCKILAAWTGDRVSLVIGLPSGFVDESPRIQRLLRKAYQQFMPGAVNVAMICSRRPNDRVDVENALLGSHVERWDALPPQGRRVAHGRAADGFWHGHQFELSQAAGWFWFSADSPQFESRIWVRESDRIEPAVRSTLERLFGAQDTDR